MNPNRSTQQGRRDLLWNISEPGDPYDIKKSMIGKLPGDKKIFMGNHLELVCLLQAAEIQRMCQFLDDYKLKFRQIERSSLDRHSYEIQIKELTQRIEDEDGIKSQNTKLVDFIKRQQAEIQYLQGASRDSNASADGLKMGYQKSLQKTNQLTNQNMNLKAQVQDLRNENLSIRARFDALEKSKNKEIQQVRTSFSQNSRDTYESGLNSMKLQYQGELRRYDIEVKRLKELNDAKNSQINDLMKQREQLARRLNILESNNELQKQIYDYQNKFVLLGQQIERLNIALRDYANKIEESDARKRELERTVQRNEFEKRDLQGKLQSNMKEVVHLEELVRRYEDQSKKYGENQQYQTNYQHQISTLQRTINDLKGQLRNESQMTRKYLGQIDNLNFQISKYRMLQKDNRELRNAADEVSSLRRKTVEYQNRIAIMMQEIQRLKSVIQGKQGEIEKTRLIFNQNQSNKSKIRELQSTIVTKYEYEMSRLKSDYESKIQNINRSKGSQMQGQSRLFQQQIERLRQTLRVKNEEGEKQKQRIYELETLISRNQLQMSNKIRNYEGEISAMRRQNEQLFNKTKLIAQGDRKVFDLQSKLQQSQRQIERLGQLIRGKDQENNGLRNRLRETEGASQNYQSDANRQLTVYQQNIAELKGQNEDLRRKMNELVNDTNKKLIEASHEIQRLGQNLRKVADEKGQMQQSLRQLSQESSIDKQKVQKSTIDNQQLLRRIVDFEGKVNNNTAHIRGIEQQNENLRRQLHESKNTINKYEGQVSHLNNNIQQTLTNAGRQNQKLMKRISEYQAKLTQLSQELVRLNQILRAKSEENANLQASYRQLANQFQNAKKQFKEYELSVKNKFEGEVAQSFNSLKNENEDLRRKLQQLDGQHRTLYQQSSQQIQNLKRRITEKDNNHNMFENQHHKKVSGYQNNIANLTRVNEDLQRKLQELDRRLQQVDRHLQQKSEECVRLDGMLKNGNVQNQNLKKQWRQSQNVAVQRYENDIKSRQGQYQQNLNRAHQQIQDLRRKIDVLKQQNDVLKKKIQGYQASIANYEAEVKKRFQLAQQTMNSMRNQNEDLRRKVSQKGQISIRLSQKEQKIALLSQQIERLQEINNNLNQEYQKLRKQLVQKTNYSSQYELDTKGKIQNLEHNLEILQRQNNDFKRKVPEYQQRMYSLSQQLQRVNTAYRNKSDQCTNMQQSFKLNYQQVVGRLTSDNEDYKRKLRNAGDVENKKNQLQTKIVHMGQDFQRSQMNLQAKQDQIVRLDQIARNQGSEIELLKKKYTDLQANSRHTIEVQVTRKYAQYQQSIADLKAKNAEYQNKIRGAMQEIQRLNNVLRLKVEESIQLNNQLNSIKESESASSQNVKSLRNEREELMRRLQQNDQNIERRIVQYQNKIRIMDQQNQRLSEGLRAKTNQLEMTRRQFKEQQESNALKIKNSYGQIQVQIDNLQRQNYQLKRKLAQAESRLGQLSQELDQRHSDLRNKTEELNRYQANSKNLVRELEEARRLLQQLSDKNRIVHEYQQKINQLIGENKRLQKIINGKDDELNGAHGKVRQHQNDVQTMKRQINEYESEVRNRMSNYEQNINQIKRQNEQLLRKRTQNQSKIALLSQQLQRISSALKNKNDEFNQVVQEYQNFKRNQASQFEANYKTLQQNYQIVTNQNETSKKHLSDYQVSIRKLHAEFQRLQTILQDLKKEKDSLFQKNKILSQEIKRLNGLNNDLEEQTKDVRLRLTDQTALQKRMSQHLSLMVVLFAQIQTLRIRVRQKEMQVVEVRNSSLAPHMV